MKKILFLRNVKANWTSKDIEALQQKYEVLDIYISSWKESIANILKVFSADILFLWFGSLSFLPYVILAKILGKKVLVVTAGYDVAQVHVGNYGAFCESPLRIKMRKFLFSLCDKILCCSKSNYFETVFNARQSPKKCELIELGFSLNTTKPLKPWKERKNQVLLISSMGDDGFYRKGVFRTLQLAERCPEIEFVLVGGIDPDLKVFIEKNYSQNIKLKGFVNFYSEEYTELIQSSKVILQLSYHEGFGASVLDAAIYGCWPVVSCEYSLAEVIGKYGSAVNLADYDDVHKELLRVLASEQDVDKLSQYYLEKYSLEKRSAKILNLASEINKKK